MERKNTRLFCVSVSHFMTRGNRNSNSQFRRKRGRDNGPDPDRAKDLASRRAKETKSARQSWRPSCRCCCCCCCVYWPSWGPSVRSPVFRPTGTVACPALAKSSAPTTGVTCLAARRSYSPATIRGASPFRNAPRSSVWKTAPGMLRCLDAVRHLLKRNRHETKLFPSSLLWSEVICTVRTGCNHLWRSSAVVAAIPRIERVAGEDDAFLAKMSTPRYHWVKACIVPAIPLNWCQALFKIDDIDQINVFLSIRRAIKW